MPAWKRCSVLWCALVLAANTAACHRHRGRRSALGASVAMADTPGATAPRWKAVLMTGDDSTEAFDHARHRLKELWTAAGVDPKDIRELSMSRAEQGGGVKAASADGLRRALASLHVQAGDGCLVHLTSHGAPWGFYLKDQDALTPATLDAALTAACGEQPTAVFVAACYSGIFTGNVMKKPNRVIFTAARDDRSSFGCGVEDEYTFWDACLIERLPGAKSWAALQKSLATCIRAKERERQLRFSYPQAYLGKLAAGLPPPWSAREEAP